MVTEPGVRRANEAERATSITAKQELVDAGHEADRRLVERVALDLPCRTTAWVEHLVTATRTDRSSAGVMALMASRPSLK